ncbi:SDR family NAD(P)-dependent oxidoreductase [Hydrocarboniphaga sp.]|uniref:SDR family NAD(P)-dependent oxidoreductase n=1 Tax=Hydrocarboniphaga sp. TaxID=2033016 RepID=UPI003D0F70F0
MSVDMSSDPSPPLLLVTGAGGGIGQGVIGAALARGWRVAAVSRRPPEPSLAGVSDSARSLYVVADVSTADGAAAAFDAAVAHFGEAPSRLCHAAGNVKLGPIERCSEDHWRQVMAANLDSAFFTLQAYGRARGDAPGGAAVLFSSVAARIGTPGHAAVAAAKAGVEGLVRALAADWSPRGRRINAIALGLTETPMTEGFTRGERSRQAVTVQYPLARLGRVAETAGWAMQLLDEDSWMTGQVLSLDGGFTAVRPLVRATPTP